MAVRDLQSYPALMSLVENCASALGSWAYRLGMDCTLVELDSEYASNLAKEMDIAAEVTTVWKKMAVVEARGWLGGTGVVQSSIAVAAAAAAEYTVGVVKSMVVMVRSMTVVVMNMVVVVESIVAVEKNIAVQVGIVFVEPPEDDCCSMSSSLRPVAKDEFPTLLAAHRLGAVDSRNPGLHLDALCAAPRQ